LFVSSGANQPGSQIQTEWCFCTQWAGIMYKCMLGTWWILSAEDRHT